MMKRFLIALAVATCIGGTARAQQQRSQPQAQAIGSFTVWNSATSLNATQTIFDIRDSGFDAVTVHLVQSGGTFSAGAIMFEASFDGTNWITLPADAVHDPTSTTWATVSLPYTLLTSTNKPFLIHTKGWQGLRIKLSTAITGTGTVTITAWQTPDMPVSDVIALSPTAANFQSTSRLNDGSGTSITSTGGALDINLKSGAIPAGTNLIGEVTPMATATTTDAASGCYIVSAASTNSNSCKGSSGNFYGVRIINTTSTIYYLRLYNSASAPTCSSATGFIESIPVPNATGTGAGLVAVSMIPIGYSTGIGYCLTGGSSSTDNTSAATGLFGAIYYK